MALYPHFTPRIAKYGGNAKVFRLAELRDFRWHYFKESPVAFVRSHLRIRWDYCAVPWLTSVLRRLGVFESAKIAYLKIFRRA
jgi:hypothetical protein